MSFNAFDIAGSGMTAQRVKMDTIASNIANINTTRNPDGSKGVYIKKDVAFKAVLADKISRGPSNFSSNRVDAEFNSNTGSLEINTGIALSEGYKYRGVEVSGIYERENAVKTVYDPSHPDADENGYVAYPNVNTVTEMTNMISATRAYEANTTAFEASKSMARTGLSIGK